MPMAVLLAKPGLAIQPYISQSLVPKTGICAAVLLGISFLHQEIDRPRANEVMVVVIQAMGTSSVNNMSLIRLIENYQKSILRVSTGFTCIYLKKYFDENTCNTSQTFTSDEPSSQRH